MIYGPPKSGKTLLSLLLASRASSSGKVVYMDFDLRRQLVTAGFIRVEPEPSRFPDEVGRGLRIAKTLEAAVVVDSLMPAIESCGLDRVVGFMRTLDPGGVSLYCTSLWYLPIGYSAVKVGRSGGRLVAAGEELYMEMDLCGVADSLKQAGMPWAY